MAIRAIPKLLKGRESLRRPRRLKGNKKIESTTNPHAPKFRGTSMIDLGPSAAATTIAKQSEPAAKTIETFGVPSEPAMTTIELAGAGAATVRMTAAPSAGIGLTTTIETANAVTETMKMLVGAGGANVMTMMTRRVPDAGTTMRTIVGADAANVMMTMNRHVPDAGTRMRTIAVEGGADEMTTMNAVAENGEAEMTITILDRRWRRQHTSEARERAWV
jgi:hypothetical protein